MTTPKKKTKSARKQTAKKSSKSKTRVTLFVDISPTSKNWLNAQCKNQVGKVSKSTMVERILVALKNKPKALQQLGVLK